jgi:2-hydroxy-6-oxonona-2,4-dienedioate hydrolase
MIKKTAKKLIHALKSAAKIGGEDLQWLKEGELPEFDVVEVGSSGPDVLLLHGLLGAVSNWDRLLPHLAQNAKATALKFPILNGKRSEVKIPSLATFTECFVRSRFTKPIVLCGNSLGGHVAMRLCLAAPELVDCLILSGSSGLYEHTVDALPVRPDMNFIREHMKRVFSNPEFITEAGVQEIHAIMSNKMNVLNIIHAARSAKKDNLYDVLPEIKVPTLLLWGEDDQITSMQVAETFSKRIPNATLVSIPRCGHAPMIEHPEWFASQVDTFLRKNSVHYNNTVTKV